MIRINREIPCHQRNVPTHTNTLALTYPLMLAHSTLFSLWSWLSRSMVGKMTRFQTWTWGQDFSTHTTSRTSSRGRFHPRFTTISRRTVVHSHRKQRSYFSSHFRLNNTLALASFYNLVRNVNQQNLCSELLDKPSASTSIGKLHSRASDVLLKSHARVSSRKHHATSLLIRLQYFSGFSYSNVSVAVVFCSITVSMQQDIHNNQELHYFNFLFHRKFLHLITCYGNLAWHLATTSELNRFSTQ